MGRKKKIRNIVLTVALWGAIWQTASLWIGSRIFLPSPFDTMQSLKELLGSVEFFHSILFSLGNIARGFLLGVFSGILLAVAASKSDFLLTFFSLPMRVIKATPVASFTILALLWIDSKQLSILISFLMVLPILYTNVLTGIRETDSGLLEMAEVFHIRWYFRVRYIYMQTVLPYLISACSVAVGLAWKSGIAAEVIGITRNSIGNHLYQSKIYLEIPELFAWTLVTIVVSVLSEHVILWLLRLLKRGLFGMENNDKEVKTEHAENTEEAEWEEQSDGNVGGSRNENAVRIEDAAVKHEREEKTSKDFADNQNIILKNVTKSYNGNSVLNRVSMLLSENHPVAVMGSSGIGKTTLLKLILGRELPDSGSIEQSGSRFAVVFQEDRLCETTSVERNLFMVCRNRRQREEVTELLGRLGLSGCAKQKVSVLSGGMKRRVAIGRALLTDAPVILLDEPFQGLDTETKQSVLQLVREKMQGKTVLLITHDRTEAEFLGCEIRQL